MKKLIFLIALMQSLSGKSCDLSFIALDSVVANGSNFSLYITACIGGGVLGTNQGADNSTQTFGFGVYGPGTVSITNFSPASVTNAITSCTNPGFVVAGAIGTDSFLLYNSPGCALTCVSSTAGCGTPAPFCNQYIIETDAMPDSVRIFGIEGAGNPYAGCYPQNDMLIDFTTIALSVTWNDVQVVALDERTRRISWETLSEENSDYFEVQRWMEGTHHWETIKTIPAAGNSTSPLYYEYLDEIFLLGKLTYYRIKQVDFDGAFAYTSILSIEELKDETPLTLVPNPAQSAVLIPGLDLATAQITLVGSDGREYPVLITSNGKIDLSALDKGLYLVDVNQNGIHTVLKLVVS